MQFRTVVHVSVLKFRSIPDYAYASTQYRTIIISAAFEYSIEISFRRPEYCIELNVSIALTLRFTRSGNLEIISYDY